jgi:hypothetical protein
MQSIRIGVFGFQSMRRSGLHPSRLADAWSERPRQVCGATSRSRSRTTWHQRCRTKSVRSHFDEVLQARRDEADEFYKAITPASLNADEANVMRQALAGMLRSKHIRKTRRFGYWSNSEK